MAMAKTHFYLNIAAWHHYSLHCAVTVLRSCRTRTNVSVKWWNYSTSPPQTFVRAA